MYPQQPGGQPPYQQGYQQPPDQGGGKSPWPWVFGAVALIVAGVIAALVITGSDNNKKEPTTINRTVQKTITQPATTQVQTQTVTVPTTVTTPPDNGGAPAQ